MPDSGGGVIIDPFLAVPTEEDTNDLDNFIS